jgi:protein TonB
LQLCPKLVMIGPSWDETGRLRLAMTELGGTTADDRLPFTQPKDRRRRRASLLAALALHVAGAGVLLAYWRADTEDVANAPLVLVELAPLPAAPETTPSEQPPGPRQKESTPSPPTVQEAKRETKREAEPDRKQPVDTTETAMVAPAPKVEEPIPAPLAPKAERPIAPPATPAEPEKPEQTVEPEKTGKPAKTEPPPKPVEQAEPQKYRPSRAQQASSPSAYTRRTERAVAPAPGASARNANALPNWKSALVNRLERYKRYPAEARGEHGVARLAFSVDRGGGVHHARIVRSSGSGALDRETLALIARAQPLPPPPPEIRGAQIAIVVPIRYSVR